MFYHRMFRTWRRESESWSGALAARVLTVQIAYRAVRELLTSLRRRELGPERRAEFIDILQEARRIALRPSSLQPFSCGAWLCIDEEK